MSHQILGFCRNNVSLVAPMALIFGLPVKRPSKNVCFCSTLIYGSQVRDMYENVLRHTNSDRTPLKTTNVHL